MGASASKIKFRESVSSLIERDVSPDDAEFWDELWKIPSSADEVFELLGPADARRLREERFDNLATLFTQATAQLCQIVETPYNIYFDQALNCVRVLTRVLPFLLEKGDLGDSDPNVEILCWGTGGGGGGGGESVANEEEDDPTEDGDASRGKQRGRKGRRKSKGSVRSGKSRASGASDDVPAVVGGRRKSGDSTAFPGVEDGVSGEDNEDNDGTDEDECTEVTDDDHELDDDATSQEDTAAVDEDDDQEPLALLVVHAAMHMLFLPQFTCDFYEEDDYDYASGSDSDDSEDDDEDDEGGEGTGGGTGGGGGGSYGSLEDDNGRRERRRGHALEGNLSLEGDASLDSDAAERQRRQRKADRESLAEAGLGKMRRVRNGVPLTPRPAGIVWAPGAGLCPDYKYGAAPKGGNKGSSGRSKRGRSRGGSHSAADPANNLGLKVGAPPDVAATRKYDKNRIEILRLLLTACCDPLFSPADEYNPLASRWMSVAVAADAPNAPCLFYSLLNTILGYDPSGSGLAVPYSNKFASDAHAKLVELSAQVLCVLLDCGMPGEPIPLENSRGDPVASFEDASRGGFNIFRVLLARINTGRELTFVYRGFVRLLRNTYEAKNTYLPSSSPRLECHQEVLVLLWKALEENPLFLDFILTRCDVCELVVPLCYLMYTARRDPSQAGLVHICTFIMLKLSGERSFGVSLNRPFRTKLPCDLPLFSGSHCDLVSITLHKLIVNGSFKLVALYSCFLTIVCNISPYWRSMSLVSAVKLVNLFELFSSPKFLYSGEKAHRHLALLLEVFNNIIQYQYNGNQHLVYAIVRRKDSFGRLAGLTLDRAVDQCRRTYGHKSRPEYDADAADIAASVRDVDEKGNPLGGAEKEEEDDRDRRRSSRKGGGGGKESKGTKSGQAEKQKAAENDDDDNDSVHSSEGVGAKFAPTESWLADLRSSLPLETVNRLLQHLVPVVDEMCERKNGVVDEIEILEVFKDITMVGLLPVPHAIVIRKYQPNQYTSIWFTAFMWGVVYLRSQKPPIFDGRCIELFQVADRKKRG